MPTLTDRRAKSFEYASDATKQLIGLATAVIAFTVTFSKDFLADLAHPLKVVAVGSWVLFLCSAICGLLILYALAGQLDPGSSDPEENWSLPSIWAGSVSLLMKAQQITFAMALLVTITFAGIALFQQRAPAPTPTCCECAIGHCCCSATDHRGDERKAPPPKSP